MLRKDGTFIIYQIEECQSKFNRWMTIADHEYIETPRGEERRKYHTASGDTWQETGIFGFYDFEVAKDYCNKLNDALKSGAIEKEYIKTAEVTEFRLVKCTFTQERVPLEFTKY